MGGLVGGIRKGSACVILLGTALLAGNRATPPQWWREQGAPGLVDIQEETLSRRGVPYMHQRVYLHVEGYRRRLKPQGKDLLLPLREGRVWIGIRDRFLVAVGAEARRDILGRLLKRAWRGPVAFSDDPDAQAFIAFSTRILEEDAEVEYLYGPSGTMWVRYGSEAPRAFRSPRLVRAMLALEFEHDPENQAGLDAIKSALKALVPPQR